MPRKTRKEKIIADLRRKVQKLSVDTTADFTITYKPKETIVTSPLIKINEAKLNADAMVIRRDLKKTFIISTLAIATEFVLYLATK